MLIVEDDFEFERFGSLWWWCGGKGFDWFYISDVGGYEIV